MLLVDSCLFFICKLEVFVVLCAKLAVEVSVRLDVIVEHRGPNGQIVCQHEVLNHRVVFLAANVQVLLEGAGGIRGSTLSLEVLNYPIDDIAAVNDEGVLDGFDSVHQSCFGNVTWLVWKH